MWKKIMNGFRYVSELQYFREYALKCLLAL